VLKDKIEKHFYAFIIGMLVLTIFLLAYFKNKEMKEFAYTNTSYLDYCVQISKHNINKLFKDDGKEFVYIPKIDQKIRNNGIIKDKEIAIASKKDKKTNIKTNYNDILNSYIYESNVNEMVDAINNLPKN